MVGNNFPKLGLIVLTLRAHRYTQLSPRLVIPAGMPVSSAMDGNFRSTHIA